jgi:cytochrome P450/NADPH-cytochrome P450 reductase
MQPSTTEAAPSQRAVAEPIPTPPRLPVLGNLLQLPRGRLTQHLMGVAPAFDGIFEIDFAGFRVPFVTSAALAAELCDEKRFRKIVKPPLSILRALAGDGLFTAHQDEPNWGKAHRILVPAFAQRARRAYFDAMLDVADQLVAKWEASGGEPIEVSEDMTRLTLDTIALCGFGYRFESFASAELHPFLQAMGRVLDETMGRLTRHRWLTRARVLANRRYDRDIAEMHALVDDVIRERRAHPVQSRDLLGLMLEAVDPVTKERLDDANIRYQVITFLIAGHETTSGLLSFVLGLLIEHPEVLARAREEVDTVLAGGRVPEYDDLGRLDVIDRILKETLRLWPTAPAFAVAPYEDTLLGGRYLIARNRQVTVLLPSLHRDPRVWTDPERFDIDRFLPENEAKIPAAAYKPFGNGQRSCIGRQFAIMEAKLALALILQRLEFESDDGRPTAAIRETLTLKPDGFRLRVRRRAPRGAAAAPA